MIPQDTTAINCIRTPNAEGRRRSDLNGNLARRGVNWKMAHVEYFESRANRTPWWSTFFATSCPAASEFVRSAASSPDRSLRADGAMKSLRVRAWFALAVL